jgi:hypothetical protein
MGLLWGGASQSDAKKETVNKFLRTATTQRLLATIAGFVVAIAAGTAIAIAAQGSGPVPKPKRLAVAIRDAVAARPVPGISADINFTNRLVDTSEIQGTDPLLSGGQGHIWISNDGRLRLELYGDNGDPEIVVNQTSWWVSDPTLRTVYEGTLPQAGGQGKLGTAKHDVLPTVAQIQAYLNRLAQHLNVSGAVPSDVGGQPTYTVRLSPQHDRGLLGQAQLAWDAIRGVPLRFAVYATDDRSSPVLEVAATNVSYGAIDESVFNLSPTAGYKVAKVTMPTAGTGPETQSHAKGKKAKQHAQIVGVAAVSRHVSFKLAAPSKLAGLTRQSVTLTGSGQRSGALLVYGQNLGGVAVIEEPATATSARQINLSSGSGDHANGIALPTFSVRGATAQELDTALGTFVRFTSGGVTYTVIGSVAPRVARAAARGL